MFHNSIHNYPGLFISFITTLSLCPIWKTSFSANPFSELVYAVNVHLVILIYNLTRVFQYNHYVCQQHLYFLFIKAIIQHIGCFKYMLNYSFSQKVVTLFLCLFW